LTAFAVLIDLKEGMGGQAFGVAVSYLELVIIFLHFIQFLLFVEDVMKPYS
jgi:hypothetical protein